MSDHIERACTKCGSLLHHEDDCKTKLACRSFEGCRGDGWTYDLSDSGSGRTCYCDCEAGKNPELRENPLELSATELAYEIGYEGDL